MLVEFAVENYRSIRNEARLSMVAGSGKENPGAVFTADGPPNAKPERLLRSAVIYGPNAGGKSNLLRALGAMRRIVLRSAGETDDLPVVPFLFAEETASAPTMFEAIFRVGGVRYQFGFRATKDAVLEEWLFAWPNGRAQRWYYRERDSSGTDQFTFGKLTGDRSVWRRATRPDMLFLTTAVSLNSKQLQPVSDWFKDTLQFFFGAQSRTFDYAASTAGRRKVIEFLQAADFAIDDVEIQQEPFSVDQLPDGMTDSIKSWFSEVLEGTTTYDARILHRTDSRNVELNLSEESDGTQKMFELAGSWLEALEDNKVLICDEMHAHLHPTLMLFLVRQFLRDGIAQLIFSTHDTSILSQDVFRRDQIWFCERSGNQETLLTPLSDFHPRKGLENLERAYLGGRYGAVPIVIEPMVAPDVSS